MWLIVMKLYRTDIELTTNNGKSWQNTLSIAKTKELAHIFREGNFLKLIIQIFKATTYINILFMLNLMRHL